MREGIHRVGLLVADIWIEKVLYVKHASVRLNIDSEHNCG